MTQRVTVKLNQQQLEVVDKLRTRYQSDDGVEEVVRAAFVEYAERLCRLGEQGVISQVDAAWRDTKREPPRTIVYGNMREAIQLEPVTGKALRVDEGEVLRIIQEEPGGQCVDFNAFNFYDYKERFDAGRTRAYNGIFPERGGCLYTNSPRDRAMFEILEMPETCTAETVGARCNAALFERGLGLGLHTNCQDTFAECIGAYGLTPDDVHDSFNMWMNTEVDPDGRLRVGKNTGRQGDYVDLLALFDTLSVPIVCGAGDIMFTSNFSLKRIRVEVYEVSTETRQRAIDLNERYNKFKNLRTPADFRVSRIRADRSLAENPSYEPRFVNYPLHFTVTEVELTPSEYELVERVRADGSVPGDSDGEIVRACAMLAHLRGPDARIRR